MRNKIRLMMVAVLVIVVITGCSNSSKEINVDGNNGEVLELDKMADKALSSLDKVTGKKEGNKKSKDRDIVDGKEIIEVGKSVTVDGIKIEVDKVVNVYHEELSENKDGEQVSFYPVVYIDVENTSDDEYRFSGASVEAECNGKYHAGDRVVNERAEKEVEGDKIDSQVYLAPGESVYGYRVMNSTDEYLNAVIYNDLHMDGTHRIELD